MKNSLTRLASLSLAVLLAAGAAAQSTGIQWRGDFQAAQAEARKTGKLMLVHFWTESCGPCKVLDQRVYNQPAVGIALNEQFIPVKINAEQSREIAQAYGVTRVPTDAVVAPDGQLVKQFVSPATPMEYIGYVSQVAAAYKTQGGGPFASAVASAPMPSATLPGGAGSRDRTTAINEAYASLATSRSADAAPAAPPTATAQPAASRTDNPYASAAATQQPTQQPSRQPAPQTAAAPAAQPAATVAAAPQLPPGSPPLGFEGYCPVTMKNEWRWVRGDVRWGAIHEGRTYLFASAAAQQEFLADGAADKYAPVLAGADVVAAVDQRRQANGKRDFAVQYPPGSGRFYLFTSQENLEKFWTDPGTYAQGAQRVAQLPAGGTIVR
ncbi:thioredoxin family protein [Botrimarina sp.]|uniref:thioredoxin family protein n=1 Tax=Botrimarina sp. TaxID=2795802 RepID=UPI0032F058CF